MGFAAAGMVMAGNGGADAQERHLLDLERTTYRQRLGPETAVPQMKKFVQVEVIQVENAQRIPLSFRVHYQPVQGDEIELGSFSLFPPDNPGTFILATRGTLRTGGSVRLTLTPVQPVDPDDEVRVWIAPLRFVKGIEQTD